MPKKMGTILFPEKKWLPIEFPILFPTAGSAARPEPQRAAAAPVPGVLRGAAAAADAAQGGARGGQSGTARWDGYGWSFPMGVPLCFLAYLAIHLENHPGVQIRKN